ncbi:MAG TPA: hypothetical protein VHS54_06875 [Jatrophihabitans sp.]|nr:hypothetical protein [Jatrophihabitans sp.]
MTDPNGDPTFDDVIQPTEQAPRDRHFHGKQPPRLDDEELERRTEQERIEAGLEHYDPNDVPPATE